MNGGKYIKPYISPKEKEMSITIAIGNDPTDIKRLNTIKQVLESQEEKPEIVDVKSWVSDIHRFLTDPSVFAEM